MLIERWEGMPPAECEPGKVWFHCTVQVEFRSPSGERYTAPTGVHFQAVPDAGEDELRQLALAKWSEVEANRKGSQ